MATRRRRRMRKQKKKKKNKKLDMLEAERFITFTDAVIAIALTLLILPLMDAANEFFDDEGEEGEQEAKTVRDYLNENGKHFFSFVISFWVVGMFWIQHERLFRQVGKFTHTMLLLNFVWMIGIVFVPIGSILIASAPNDQTGHYGIYIGPLLLSRIASLIMSIIILRDERTWKKGSNIRLENSSVIMNSVMILLLVIALLLSLFTDAGAYSLFVLAAGRFIDRLIKKKIRSSSGR